MPRPQTDATHYHAQLGLSDNIRVGCPLCSNVRIYDLWGGSLDKLKVRGLVLCCDQNGYRAQVIPQHPMLHTNAYMFN